MTKWMKGVKEDVVHSNKIGVLSNLYPGEEPFWFRANFLSHYWFCKKFPTFFKLGNFVQNKKVRHLDTGWVKHLSFQRVVGGQQDQKNILTQLSYH